MTLQEILDGENLEVLERMTDAELLVYCKPYLEVTRPELAVKDRGPSVVRVDPKLQMQVKKCADLGLDLSFLLKKKKR